MGRYLAAILGGGRNEHGSVLEPPTLAGMFAANYQPHPRIPGMGLAFWRRDAGGHLVVEHLGVMPGFNSQICVAPADGVGVMAFMNGTRRNDGLPVELPAARRVLGVPDAGSGTTSAAPGDLGQLCTGTTSRPAHGHGSGHRRCWSRSSSDARACLALPHALPALYRGRPG
jgi:hypothetical protein